MAYPIFANNANTTLASGLTSGATSVVLATGTGALFPSPATGQFFPITFNDAATGLLYEICYCTSRTGDTLTVTRGQEGTTARSWSLGDYAYCAFTENTWPAVPGGTAYTTPGTYTFTVPTAVWVVECEAWGAGGGGDGSTSYNYPGGPGGGGGYGRGRYTVSPGQTLTVVVGAGGSAGAAGGTSSVSGTGVSMGGAGGSGGTQGNSSTFGTAGPGGSATGNLFAFGGGQGNTITTGGPPPTLWISTAGAAFGGTNQFAAGGSGSATNGGAGQVPGGGSTGCTATPVGGANGQVIITW